MKFAHEANRLVSNAKWMPIIALMASQLLTTGTHSDDWPQWRGASRDGVWREGGILESFPAGGVKIRWRARIGLGYSGPVVALGRVFVTDHLIRPTEVERVLCFVFRGSDGEVAVGVELSHRLRGHGIWQRAASVADGA